jgi:arsenite-transporting ATPase
MGFMAQPTRHLFFTGKGGVGKTSLSCATALRLADQGRRVLLVSTDPASNLDEVLGVHLGPDPLPVPGAEGLEALNIDPEVAAAAYRDKVVGPYRGLLPEATLRNMEEQLSGSCTMEIAAFDAFSRLLGDPARTAGYDHVIFDTAPTGHTLRLLFLPGAWSSFIETNTTGTSCLGPLAGLQAQHELYRQSLAALSDPARTTLVLVSRAEASALREAERSSRELRELGVSNQHLVLNGLFTATDPSDALAAAFERRGREALAALPGGLGALPREEIRLNPSAMVGLDALRSLFDSHMALVSATSVAPGEADRLKFPSLDPLVDDLEQPGKGVIMTMGKGGVGKTTLAVAIALELARRGHAVSLSTTDPAAHVAWMIENPPPGLRVGCIDPARETEAYRQEVMDTTGSELDEQGKALLLEDLRSPCTEEIAVFRAFARTVAEGQGGFVVLDTAPTGHTILLLDAAEAYHREVLRQSSQMPESVKALLPSLRDPGYTRVLLVTLPEATPVHEAGRLEQDLDRAGIPVFAWVINQALTPHAIQDPLLARRRASERPYILEVAGHPGRRVTLIPWQSDPLAAFRSPVPSLI